MLSYYQYFRALSRILIHARIRLRIRSIVPFSVRIRVRLLVATLVGVSSIMRVRRFLRIPLLICTIIHRLLSMLHMRVLILFSCRIVIRVVVRGRTRVRINIRVRVRIRSITRVRVAIVALTYVLIRCVDTGCREFARAKGRAATSGLEYSILLICLRLLS